jgi:TRAP-type C4-dicarboxylate transport system permease small subunit
MLRSAREGTLIFKDLIFPQWWLDWIIPLASLAMLLQALEMLVTLVRTPHPPHHHNEDFVPGIQPEELP